jgi:5-methylcytosine-specific restriction protein A
LRLMILRRNPLCAECYKAGRIVAAEHVHHVIERKQRPELALDPSNLQALCAPCHNRQRRGSPSGT